MTDDEKFELLRQCVAFGSAMSPYVLTDDQESELYDFLSDLQNN